MKSFKPINGRSGPTAFLPLDSKIGGQINCNRPSVGQFLTREQSSYVYKKTESGEIINADTIQQEIEQEKQLNKLDDTSGDINPYKELIVNNAEKLGPLMTQMKQWSTLSNILNYVQHDRHPRTNYNLSIKAVHKHKNSSEERKEREIMELDFGVTPKYYEKNIWMCMREFNPK